MMSPGPRFLKLCRSRTSQAVFSDRFQSARTSPWPTIPAFTQTQSRRQQSGASSQKDPSLNPLVEEQKVYKAPVFPESGFIFFPSTADIEKAEKLFVPSKRHVIKYLQGAYHPSDIREHKKAEIAFMGRSNVGKSSLIKALLRSARDLEVRTSRTPGHTKLLNFFEVGQAFMLVDMPGYGFRQPENFEHTAEGYLKSSKKLTMPFLLIDSHVGLQPMDYVAIDMLKEFGIPFMFILTKADKATKRSLYTTLASLKKVIDEKSSTCLPQPLLVSAIKSTGIPYLKAFLAYITGNLDR